MHMTEFHWSFVYFIGEEKRGPVKIGMSGAPELRLQNLQSSYPYPLAILAQFPGGEEEEEAMHKLFRPFRLQGEWFKRDTEILQFIDIMNCRVPLHLATDRIVRQRPKRRLKCLRQAVGNGAFRKLVR